MFQFAGTYISSSVLDCKNFANLTHLSYFIKRFYIKCRYVTKSSQKVLFRYSLANSNIQPYSNPILHKRALQLGTQTKINFVKPLLCVYNSTSVTRKNPQMSIKVGQKWFQLKNDIFWHLYKNCLRMCKIWTNLLLPKVLNSCPKSYKSPNLVTLKSTQRTALYWWSLLPSCSLQNNDRRFRHFRLRQCIQTGSERCHRWPGQRGKRFRRPTAGNYFKSRSRCPADKVNT